MAVTGGQPQNQVSKTVERTYEYDIGGGFQFEADPHTRLSTPEYKENIERIFGARPEPAWKKCLVEERAAGAKGCDCKNCKSARFLSGEED